MGLMVREAGGASPGQGLRAAPRSETLEDVLRRYTFELATAVVWMLNGAAFFVAPHSTLVHSAVGRDVGDWAYVWSALYVAAGPAIIYGLVAQKPQHRLAGLILLSSGLCMHGVAAATGQVVGLRAFTYFVFAIACILRALLIVRQTPRRA